MNEHQESLRRWDAVPRDGPAVFIIDTLLFDESAEIQGDWIAAEGDVVDLATAIEAVVGPDRLEAGQWAVFDQVGLGTELVPEQLSITALVELGRARGVRR
jgi:hypothetical protein